MSDIFVSYASEDRDKAQQLAQLLESQGWSVFWDRTIRTGEAFDEVIEAKLDSAKCVIVMWSKAAVASSWVRNEAEEGRKREILLPLFLGQVRIPLAFRHIQTADLSLWRGEGSHAECEKLLADVGRLVGVDTGGKPTDHRFPDTDPVGTVIRRVVRKILEPWFTPPPGPRWLKATAALSQKGGMVLFLAMLGYYYIYRPATGRVDPPAEVRAPLPVAETPLTTSSSHSVITDSRSGLMWTRKNNGEDVDWYLAKRYCEELRLASYSDWRLPSIEELSQIYDPTNVTGKFRSRAGDYDIHTIDGFQLSTPLISSATRSGGSAWYFHFGNGERKFNHVGVSYFRRALCVRRSGE